MVAVHTRVRVGASISTVCWWDFMACYRQLNVLLMSYSRSQQLLDAHGANSNVAMIPDGSVLLISVSRDRKALG